MNNLLTVKTLKSTQGFSLIEVLIALIILSVGLLGMAGLQVTSLRGAHDAELSSQAVNLTADIAERIRVNPSQWVNYATVIPTEYSAHARFLNSDCVTQTCTPAQATNYDLLIWKQNIEAFLPGAAGTPGGTGDIALIGNDLVITTTWVDRGANKQYQLRLRN